MFSSDQNKHTHHAPSEPDRIRARMDPVLECICLLVHTLVPAVFPQRTRSWERPSNSCHPWANTWLFYPGLCLLGKCSTSEPQPSPSSLQVDFSLGRQLLNNDMETYYFYPSTSATCHPVSSVSPGISSVHLDSSLVPLFAWNPACSPCPAFGQFSSLLH